MSAQGVVMPDIALADAAPPLLAVRGLRRHFGGVRAVEDIGFSLAAGELLALIGPNGAGKSTCFNLINDQLRPDAGQVLLSGREITGMRPRDIWRLGVGRTFQVAATWSTLSVIQNVQVALLSRQRQSLLPWRRAAPLHRDEAMSLLDALGIGALADAQCGTLAYGDLKSVELAIALANRPSLLLMDEPTAGMAPRERLALMALVRRLARERAIAVLFTEHSMDVVFGHADRVLVMARGRVIAEGSPETIRRHPDVISVYLGSGRLARRSVPDGLGATTQQ